MKSFANADEAAEFEQEAIKLGWALPLTGGGRPKSWSPFDDIANQVRERHNEYDYTPEQVANEVFKHDAPKPSVVKTSKVKKKGT